MVVGKSQKVSLQTNGKERNKQSPIHTFNKHMCMDLQSHACTYWNIYTSVYFSKSTTTSGSLASICFSCSVFLDNIYNVLLPTTFHTEWLGFPHEYRSLGKPGVEGTLKRKQTEGGCYIHTVVSFLSFFLSLKKNDDKIWRVMYVSIYLCISFQSYLAIYQTKTFCACPPISSPSLSTNPPPLYMYIPSSSFARLLSVYMIFVICGMYVYMFSPFLSFSS